MEKAKRATIISKMAKIIPLIAFYIYRDVDFWGNNEIYEYKLNI